MKVLRHNDCGFKKIKGIWYIGVFIDGIYKIARPAKNGDFKPYRNADAFLMAIYRRPKPVAAKPQPDQPAQEVDK